MEKIVLPVLVIIGILVIIRGVSIRGGGKSLGWIILLLIFGPVIYGIIKAESLDFIAAKHPWWIYLLLFFAALLVLRFAINFIFQGRRR